MNAKLTPELRTAKKEAEIFHLQRVKEIQENPSPTIPNTDYRWNKERFTLIHFVPLENDNEYLVDFAKKEVDAILKKLRVEENQNISFCAHASQKLTLEGIYHINQKGYSKWGRNGAVEIFNTYLWNDRDLADLLFWVDSFVARFTNALLSFKKILEVSNFAPLYFSVHCTLVQNNSYFRLGDDHRTRGGTLEGNLFFPPFVLDSKSPTTFFSALNYLKPFWNAVAQAGGEYKCFDEKMYTEAFWKERKCNIEGI